MRTLRLTIASPTRNEPPLPGLVVFQSSVAEALDLVRDEAGQTPDRVLAVGLGSGLRHGEAFQLLRAGASDVVTGGPDGTTAEKLAARVNRWAAVDQLIAGETVQAMMGGASPAWKRVLREIVEVAAFTEAPVLITGETGTGKEVAARLIHALDRRSDKRDFVVLDCTTVVPGLSGSEFFGHEKGSFTGATSVRNGAFALANDGTLFLDEVGELPLPLQAELLRVVQEHTYKRIGGSVWQNTRFRLVCATNRDLECERREGRFRSDLFYRISGWTFHLPPLRERRDDILPLAERFLAEQLRSAPDLDEPVRDYLLRRGYGGNIRELRQLVTRMAHRHVGPGPLTVGAIGDEASNAVEAVDDDWCDGSFRQSIGRAIMPGVGLKEIGRQAEDVAVQLAVRGENGSLQEAARRLGVTDRALQLRRASQRALPAEGEDV